MKLRLAALVAGALLASSANAQLDVGYDVGYARFDQGDSSTKNRAVNNVKVGYQDERNGLGAEAIYTYTPKAKSGSDATRHEQSAVGSKLLAKAEVPFDSRFSGVVKGGMGYQSNRINFTNSPVEVKKTEYFPTVTAGVNYKATEQLKVGLNVNHDSRDNLKFSENTYLTAGFNYSFEGSKLA